jgi:hypothetical protein
MILIRLWPMFSAMSKGRHSPTFLTKDVHAMGRPRDRKRIARDRTQCSEAQGCF